MLKKLVSVVLTFTMIAVSSTTSMASEEMSFSKAMAAKELNLNVSDIKRVDYVNCANITADKVISISCNGSDVNVSKTEPKFLLKKIELNNLDYSLYVLSASSDLKYSVNSKNASGITINGTIAWYDHPGVDNELYYVKGNRSGTYRGGVFTYGKVGYNKERSYKWDTASFYNDDLKGMKGFGFELIISMRDKNNNVVRMSVNTSVFD